jgi:nicotinamide mononucleotide transporter
MDFLSIIEILGLLFGILYIVLMIAEKWYSWLFGIVAVTLYGISCYQYKIYGEMFLQIIYIIISLYGIYSWRKNTAKILLISKLSVNEWFKFIFLGLIIAGFSFIILIMLQGAMPILDALTNGFALVATYLAAKKKLGNWIVWVPVNALTIYMMFSKDMHFYAVLYLLYGLFAILGFYQWQKTFESQTQELESEVSN